MDVWWHLISNWSCTTCRHARCANVFTEEKRCITPSPRNKRSTCWFEIKKNHIISTFSYKTRHIKNVFSSFEGLLSKSREGRINQDKSVWNQNSKLLVPWTTLESLVRTPLRRWQLNLKENNVSVCGLSCLPPLFESVLI